jgi:hypothetical protein
MAFDARLAERVRSTLAGRDGLTEKKMFGGVAFFVGGNMACGVYGRELIVRLDAVAAEAALAEPGTRVFDVTGRSMPSCSPAGWAEPSISPPPCHPSSREGHRDGSRRVPPLIDPNAA